MYYSEEKERGNRFITALKIGFPFLLFMAIYVYLRISRDIENKEVILLSALAISYVYYIFYMIYRGFQTSLIDYKSKAFSRKYMFREIDKLRNKKPKSMIVMLRIENIHDISERYGIVFGDKVLSKVTKQLYDFLSEKNYTKIPIGRYGGGYFLILIEEQTSILNHNFNIFKKLLKNRGIDGVELKVDFSITSIKYDKNINNIISHLLDQFEHTETRTLLKPDVYDKLICQAIDEKSFVFSYQPMLELSTKKLKIYEILTKLKVKEFGNRTNNDIRAVINRNGYERIYDENMFTKLVETIEGMEDNILFCVHISPVILRNNKFKKFIKIKANKGEIDPTKFILAFVEEKKYDEIKRFEEIINDYKKLGFKILLNQFGGSNSSAEYIKYIDADYASFDLEFSKYLKQPRYHELLQSYIVLLKSLHIKSIVKFVETPFMYETLKKMNVDMLQGYMIGKPRSLTKEKKI